MTDYVKANSSGDEALAETIALGLAPGEIVLGCVLAIDTAGKPLVHYPQLGEDNSLVALSTLPVTHKHIGRQVALLFTNGDYRQPVIMGFIHSPLHDLLENFVLTKAEGEASDELVFAELDAKNESSDATNELKEDENTVRVDGKKIIIEGQEEIVFSCGQASITLTKAGKVLIRGKYLLSRSSGVNRIQGGSVQVN